MNDISFIFRIDKVSNSNIRYIGSAFFINTNGLFLTAKHNFETGKLKDYRAYIDNEHYEISHAENIYNNQKFCDFGIYQVAFRIRKTITTARYRKIPIKQVIGSHVAAIGFDSSDGRIKQNSLHVSDYRNGLLELTGCTVSHGFSGGAVLYNGLVIGVITSRSTDQKLYAYCLSDINEKINLDIPSPPIFDEKKIKVYSLNNEINKIYLEIGNPIKSYDIAYSLLYIFREQIIEHPFVFASSKISLAYMLINSDRDQESLYIAINHLNEALDSLLQLQYSEEVLRSIVRANWLIAISYRLLGKHNEAFSVCENMIHDRIFSSFNYELKLPIIREIAIIENDTKLFDEIREREKDYSHNRIEHFFSCRRLLEHYIKIGKISTAEKYLSATQESFQRVKKHIFKVYEATFLKNQIHLYLAKKEIKEAKLLYSKAVSLMETNEFYGQRRSLDKIAKMYEFNDVINLLFK